MSFTRTEVEKLKIFIDKRFATQEELAHLLGMTPEGLSKSLSKSRKTMDGRLSSSLINKLKGKGISITVELSDEHIAKIMQEEPEEFVPLTQAAEEAPAYSKALAQKDEEIIKLKEKLKKLQATRRLRV